MLSTPRSVMARDPKVLAPLITDEAGRGNLIRRGGSVSSEHQELVTWIEKSVKIRSDFAVHRPQSVYIISELASTFAPECRRKFEAQFGGYGEQAFVTLSRVLHGTRS